MSEPQRGIHLPALTGMRGFAACWVVLLHCAPFVGITNQPQQWGGISVDPIWLIACGYFGVDLFFVLSGFLLSMPFHRAIAGEREWPSLREFWSHRLRRVLPAYWLQLLILVVAYAALGQFDRIEALNVAAHVALVQNLLPGSPPLLNGVYWSMPVEWDFYLVLPLLALLLRRAHIGWVVLLVVVWSISYRLLCYVSAFDPNAAAWTQIGLLHQLPGRLDQFLAGIAAAWVLLRRPTWLRRPGLWLLAGLLGVLAMGIGAGDRGNFIDGLDAPWLFFHHSLIAAAFALLILGVAAGSRGGRRLFGGRVIVWLGQISFSLYLWHYPLLLAVRGTGVYEAIGLSPALGVVLIALPVILLVSWLSYRYVERPFLVRRSAAVPASATVAGGD